MDPYIPVVELHDDDDLRVRQPVITLDDDIKSDKVPIVTLDDDDVKEHCVISLETDDIQTDPVVILDDLEYGGSTIASSAFYCHSILSDDSVVGDSEPLITLDDNEDHVISLSDEEVSEHFGNLENADVVNTSDSCTNNNNRVLPGQHLSRATTSKTSFSEKRKLFECKSCKKCFNDKYKHESHVCIQSCQNPLKCEECDEIFTEKNTLMKHSKIHNTCKPYVCDICFKAFGDKNILRMHYNTHTGEKPFACTICDQVFSNTLLLRNHYQMHIGEKPYVCDVCLASFDHKSSLCSHKLDEHHFLTLV